MLQSIAHIRDLDGKIQSVEDHLLQVRKLAENYGDKIGVKHIAGLAGLLHDLGKYSAEFKNYIQTAVKDENYARRMRGKIDHSTAGGKLLFDLLHRGKIKKYPWILAEVVGNAIISHHAYLNDFVNEKKISDYLARVEEKQLEHFEEMKANFFNLVLSEAELQQYIDKAIAELESYLTKTVPDEPTDTIKLLFLTKFIFSVLIDADRTNTREFEQQAPFSSPERHEQTEHFSLFENYYEKLMDKLQQYEESADAQSPINQLRKDMSLQCEHFAQKPSDTYTLSIPTGGGKTLASLRYALKHSLLYKKKRIFYIVPFTTIIEQNALEIKKILQDDEHILEHHSNVVINEKAAETAEKSFKDQADDEGNRKLQNLKLAKDNWDAPIIFTTMVQFLNVFFAYGNRNVRRLHNLSDAVIIFDEVQKVPTESIYLFNLALNFLKTYCHCSLVLCTATQPALDFVEQKLAISPNAEIIHNLDQILPAFKRVEIVDRASNESFDHDQLADFVTEKINKVNSVLVILNTKSVVRKLYELLDLEQVHVHHLSTSMCAAHRHKILAKVHEQLQKEEKVVCISTQLIEAGVDISFACVIRSLAGLDSIAQAAGRCNRHGKHPVQQVFVVEHQNENLDKLKEIEKAKKITKKIFIDLKRDPTVYQGDILSVKAMARYFQEFYGNLESEFGYTVGEEKNDNKSINTIFDMLTKEREDHAYLNEYERQNKKQLRLYNLQSYRTAAKHYKAIDTETQSVLAPFGAGEKLITELNSAHLNQDLGAIFRRAQPFSVNLFGYEIAELEKNDGLVLLYEGQILALKETAYNQNFGVDITNESFAEPLLPC